jgi:hypothetical protein
MQRIALILGIGCLVAMCSVSQLPVSPCPSRQPYNVEVDTSQHTPDTCAALILAALARTQTPRAFHTMATQFKI